MVLHDSAAKFLIADHRAVKHIIANKAILARPQLKNRNITVPNGPLPTSSGEKTGKNAA